MRGREVAERLAGAGARLGQQQVRLVRHPFRREDVARLQREIELLRAAFGQVGALQVAVQRLGHLGLRERHGARLTFRRLVLPLLQKGPHVERGRRRVIGRHVGPGQRGVQQRRPRPALLFHQFHAAGRRQPEAERRGRQCTDEAVDHVEQRARRVLRRLRLVEAARQGQPRRRRRAELRRTHEGEQLQHVENPRLAVRAVGEQPGADQRRVGDDQRRAPPKLAQLTHRCVAAGAPVPDMAAHRRPAERFGGNMLTPERRGIRRKRIGHGGEPRTEPPEREIKLAEAATLRGEESLRRL